MKKLIASMLIFAASLATADSYFMPNQAGGRIVITTQECRHEKGKGVLRHAYATTESGAVLPGCWYVADQLVHIVFFSGHRVAFEMTAFQRSDAEERKAPPATRGEGSRML